MPNNVLHQSKSVIASAFSALRSDIMSGRFAPGEKLPGERELCQHYSIGRSSMRQVLNQLQSERYIERIPVYGTFIRKDLASHVEQISLAFVSSDASFDPEKIGLAGWSSITEIMRGIYEETSLRPGVRMTVQHCEDTTDSLLLQHQLEDLERFDGVIFCGYQMGRLKELYAQQGKPGIVVAPKLAVIPERFPSVVFDYSSGISDLISVITTRHSKQEVVLFYHRPHFVDVEEHEKIIRELSLQLRACGISFTHQMIDHTSSSHESCEDSLAYLEETCGDFRLFEGKILWCLNRSLLGPLNYLLLAHGVHAELMGFSVSMVQWDFLPRFHYLLEPFCQTGHVAVQALVEQCLHGTIPTNITLKPTLYFGKDKVSTNI